MYEEDWQSILHKLSFCLDKYVYVEPGTYR